MLVSAFLPTIQFHHQFYYNSRRTCNKPKQRSYRRPLLKSAAEQPSEAAEEKNDINTDNKSDLERSFVLSDDILATVLEDTMLSGRTLGRAYSSERDGFSNVAFFERLQPLDGVPSLVLGITKSGDYFGGYTSHGFAARDDYRDVSTPRGLFVFAVRNGNVIVAEPTDRVLYDFYDYAVRLGAGLLGIPMNPAKHIMRADMGTSSCRMSDGYNSVFGDSTMATLEYVEVLVAQEYLDALRTQKKGQGLFSRLFG